MKEKFMRYLFILSLLFLLSCESSTETEQKDDSYALFDSSDITCPNCGHTEIEILPTDQCLIKYDCKHCEETLTPQGDDCCVFCSYGNHECPSIQKKKNRNKDRR